MASAFLGRSRIDDALVARVVRSLTDRDRYLLGLLDDHRVLTIHQITDVGFDSPERARHRLLLLHRCQVVDRFRPARTTGSAPYHYVLGELGREVVAAQRGRDLERANRFATRALAFADSSRLAHLVGVNGFFCSLIRTARHSGGRAALERWWGERRCAEAMAGLAYPDGYGIWAEDHARVEFCLEHDRGTEPLGRLAAKLDGYHRLEETSGVRRWVLFSVGTERREHEARRALRRSPVPVATAPRTAVGFPDGPVWAPLDTTVRLPLAGLGVHGR